MSNFKDMPDDFLKRNYVPDVYQHSIYKIDYQKLKDAGIRFLSFDIDDTIAGLEAFNPPKAAKTLFENLKNMGFEIMLLSNALDNRVADFAKKLGIEGKYIAQAKKPLTSYFAKLQEICGLEKGQMAHIGNSIMDDVAGGNAFGVTTCLVRRAGVLAGLPQKIPVIQPEGKKLREELKKRGIWRKHHKYVDGDQYYQLGEIPGYITSEQADAYAGAMQSHERAYIESLKDLIK